MQLDPNTGLYFSYLLRLWRINSQPARWQISVRDARTGESFKFEDLQQLMLFLDQRITGDSSVDESDV